MTTTSLSAPWSQQTESMKAHMSDDRSKTPWSLLTRPVKVVNVGLERFARELESQAVPVVQVEWAPPAGGNAKLAALLAKLGS